MNPSFIYILTFFLLISIGCSRQTEKDEPLQEGEDISENIQDNTNLDIETGDEASGTNEVIMTIDPPAFVTGSMDSATLQITNNTSGTLTYGLRYIVEESHNDEWKKLDYLDDIVFEDIQMVVNAGDTRDETIHFKLENQDFTRGLYRLCKTMQLMDRDTTICTQFRVE